ncbi:Uncharacterised protein [Shigella sonnei]|nr:Uncharacterised protein [Shigella sonnei]
MELSPRKMQLGYFHVIADPVSDCVHDILLFSPSHKARLVTKLRIPPVLLSPGNQFCTVEYFTSAFLWMMTSTTAACN